MKILRLARFLALGAAAWAPFAASADARSRPTERQIIEALTKRPAAGTRRSSDGRDLVVTGVPSIDLRVNFGFDSAVLDPQSRQTLDVLGRALASPALRGQAIEVVGHTDARGTLAYNDTLSARRAKAVVTYIVRKHARNPGLISWKGMGERELLDRADPEAAVNRRVEIRNVTPVR